MSRFELAVLVLVLTWMFLARLDRIGRATDYSSYCVRREMAELLGKQDRANQLKEEWERGVKEQRRERRRERIGFIIFVALALVWFAATSH